MLQRTCLCALIGASAALTGCASIVNGQNQPLSVETRNETGPVAGATCKLSNNKGSWFVTTPGSATVQRSYGNLAIHCTKDGHPPGEMAVKSSTKPMAFGNILFGGAIGVAVDVGTGAAYDYPTLITVQMGTSATVPPQQTAEAAPAAPGAK
jgi:hypothetical protein